MDREHVKGAADKAKGAIKDAAGKVTGDKKLESEGKMDKEHVKGAADKAKGAIKETAGKMTGDKKLETEGKVDKVKGAVQKAVGDAKDALKK